jgi:hypothetical protein
VSDTDIHIVKCNVLNAVQSQEIIALKDRIKRLEEAGDVLLRDNDDMANINQWRKAKEAKP